MFQDIKKWFESPDGIFQILGLLGYIILISEMILHSIKTCRTKKIKNISWKWILSYLIGSSFLFSYSLYFELWAIFLPISFQIIVIIIVIYIKIFFKNHKQSQSLLNNNNIQQQRNNDSNNDSNNDRNSNNDSDNDSLLEFDMNKSNKIGSSAYQTSPSYEQVVPNQFIL